MLPNKVPTSPVFLFYNHGLRGGHFTAELFDLLVTGHKSSVYQVQNTLFTKQSSVRNCHKRTNSEQFRTKCCVKIVATLSYMYHRCLVDKNITKMIHQEGTLGVFFFSSMSRNLLTSFYHYLKSTKHVA